MSAFEFFFSFYGLLLGLSVAVIATGMTTAIQHRKSIKLGWLTPMLAAFVALDIATFWTQAWGSFRAAPFSYGLLVIGMLIALTYFAAASLVFPHQMKDGDNIDDHFWANKKLVLLLIIAANIVMGVLSFVFFPALSRDDLIGGIVVFAGQMLVMGVGAFAKGPRVFAAPVGLLIAVNVILAVMFVPIV